MTQYIERFESHVYKRLGGLDMAEDFFHRHPDVQKRLRGEAIYHHRKGGSAWKGAAIFHRWVVRPRLRADREEAMRAPIGGDR